MTKTNNRDDFNPKVKDAIAKRASYICSSHSCRSLTLCASEADPEKYVYNGKIAHITAASEGGPRYDSSLSSKERSSVENGIFLCSNCADIIDKNKGVDYSPDVLRKWKMEHEMWCKENLNRSPYSLIAVVDGEHHAKGIGTVTGLDVQGPALLKPGTKVVAEGVGNITATRINNRKGKSNE